MDRENLQQLFINMQDIFKLESRDEKLALLKENNQLIVEELTGNLNDTIEFLNTCSEKELYLSCAFILDLTEYFRTNEFVKVVEDNMARVKDKSLAVSIKLEIDFIKDYLNRRN